MKDKTITLTFKDVVLKLSEAELIVQGDKHTIEKILLQIKEGLEKWQK